MVGILASLPCPVHTHPGICTPVCPRVHRRPAMPCCTAAAMTGRGALAALTHHVAERNIRNGSLTVAAVTDTRFTVGHS